MRELFEHEIDIISGAARFLSTLTYDHFYMYKSIFKESLLVEFNWSSLSVWMSSVTNAEGTIKSSNASYISFAWKAP